jgi:VWFA-related protein
MTRRQRSLRFAVPLLAGAALLAGVGVVAVQQPTFTTKVEAVRLDVLVTRDGRPVAGLGQADFEVRDQGVAQRLDFVALEQVPLNVILALDVSDSMRGERLRQLQVASHAAIDALAPGDEAGLVVFHHRVALAAPESSRTHALKAAIDALQCGGGTAVLDATYASMVLSEGAAGRSLIVVFTDGGDTASYLTTDAVLDIARRTATVVYGVALGATGRRTPLERIANQTGGSLVPLASNADLKRAFVGILDEFRQRYLLSYTPTGVKRVGWHAIEVRVRNRKLTVKTRPGYQVGRTDPLGGVG